MASRDLRPDPPPKDVGPGRRLVASAMLAVAFLILIPSGLCAAVGGLVALGTVFGDPFLTIPALYRAATADFKFNIVLLIVVMIAASGILIWLATRIRGR